MSHLIDTATGSPVTQSSVGAISSASIPLLPDEVMLHLFSFMTPSDITACSCVNREWCRVASDNALWASLFKRDFPPLRSTEEAKQIYRQHSNLANGVYATTVLQVVNDKTAFSCSLVLTEEGQLVSGFSDGTIKILDLKTQKCLKTLKGHIGGVVSLIFTKGGQLISGSSDGTIKIWDLKTGKCLNTLFGHEGEIISIILTEKGYLISGSRDKSIRIWDLEKGLCKVLSREAVEIVSLILTKEGQLISGFLNGTIKIWDLKTEQCIRTLQMPGPMTSLFLIEGKQLVSGYYNGGQIHVWDLDPFQRASGLAGHTSGVNILTVTKDGKVVSEGPHDREIKVWDLKTGNRLNMLDRPRDMIQSFISTEDGQFISGARASGAIKILDFNASHKTIFQELADRFAKMNKQNILEYATLTERFLRMPKKERWKIYGELYEILKPFSKDYWQCGEHAFHDQSGLRSTGEQKAQAITNYLNRLIKVPENTTVSPVEKIVQKKPTEEEAFQYLRDILQITMFSAEFLKKAGLESIDDLQAIGISPHQMEIFQPLRKELIKLCQVDEQAAIVASLPADPYKALETIIPMKYFIDSILVNLSSLSEVVDESSTFQNSIHLQSDSDVHQLYQQLLSDLLKLQACFEQLMQLHSACDEVINSGNFFNIASWFLNACVQLEPMIKDLHQSKLLKAYLSQPSLNEAWENLHAMGITSASQLAQHMKPAKLYQLADTLPAPEKHG